MPRRIRTRAELPGPKKREARFADGAKPVEWASMPEAGIVDGRLVDHPDADDGAYEMLTRFPRPTRISAGSISANRITTDRITLFDLSKIDPADYAHTGLGLGGWFFRCVGWIALICFVTYACAG